MSAAPSLRDGAVKGGRPLTSEVRLIGLTGGIACGKSAVSQALAQRGAVIVDADQVARAVVAPKSAGLKALVARWGSGLLSAEGGLDRVKLGAIVFSSPEARVELEGILHPLIAKESARQIEEALNVSPAVPLVVYDAALLVEAGRAEEFRPLVVVYTSRETQLQRIMDRDQLSLEEAKKRLDAQMPADEKARSADWVILNEGDGLDTLEPAIDKLWEALSRAP